MSRRKQHQALMRSALLERVAVRRKLCPRSKRWFQVRELQALVMYGRTRHGTNQRCRSALLAFVPGARAVAIDNTDPGCCSVVVHVGPRQNNPAAFRAAEEVIPKLFPVAVVVDLVVAGGWHPEWGTPVYTVGIMGRARHVERCLADARLRPDRGAWWVRTGSWDTGKPDIVADVAAGVQMVLQPKGRSIVEDMRDSLDALYDGDPTTERQAPSPGIEAVSPEREG